MECQTFEEQIDAYIDGELSAAACAEQVEHAACCPACAALLAEMQQVSRACRELPEIPLPSELQNRLHAALQVEIAAAPRPLSFRQKIASKTVAVRALAAALVLFWGVGAYLYVAPPLNAEPPAAPLVQQAQVQTRSLPPAEAPAVSAAPTPAPAAFAVSQTAPIPLESAPAVEPKLVQGVASAEPPAATYRETLSLHTLSKIIMAIALAALVLLWIGKKKFGKFDNPS